MIDVGDDREVANARLRCHELGGTTSLRIVPVAARLLSLGPPADRAACRRGRFPSRWDLPRYTEVCEHMANIKSQIKRNRQNEKRRLRNKSVRSEVKSAMKKVLLAAEAGVPTDDLFWHGQKQIDKGGTKGESKPNVAARKKSRLGDGLRRRRSAGLGVPAA